jgi:hypothetical protein
MSDPLSTRQELPGAPALKRPALTTSEEPQVEIPASAFEEASALLNTMEGRLDTMKADSDYDFDQMLDEHRRNYRTLTQKFRDEKFEDIARLRKLLSISSGG